MKATLINAYLPVISQWEAPYFVTLTAKACKANSLPKRLKDMVRGLGIITTKARKRKPGAGIGKLKGIRALECCFNPTKHTYNPHFHLIVPDKATANYLINEWLRLCTPMFAVRYAQNAQRIGYLEGSLIETIKYGAKIFTEPDLDKKAQGNINPTIYAAALYNIFDAKGLGFLNALASTCPSQLPELTRQGLLLIILKCYSCQSITTG